MEALSRKHSHEPRQYGGYALQVAVRLEAACPGFLLKTFFASPLRRQALFAAFVETDLDSPDRFIARIANVAPETLIGTSDLDPLARIARALIAMRAKSIIRATYGSCPPGLLGLLARVGADPLQPQSTYTAAHRIFADPHFRARANIFRQTPGEVSAAKIAIVADLDDVVAHKALVDRLCATGEHVSGVARFVELIRERCGASDHEITTSLDALPAKTNITGLSGWIEGWMKRQTQPPTPSPFSADDPDFRVRVGADLVDLGRRFQNCAAQRLASAFVAEHLYVEWVGQPGPEAIIELHRVEDGDQVRWIAEDVRVRRNRSASAVVVAAVRAKLVERGVLVRPAMPGGHGHRGLRRLLNLWNLDPLSTYEDETEGDAEPGSIEQVLANLDRQVNGDAAEAA